VKKYFKIMFTACVFAFFLFLLSSCHFFDNWNTEDEVTMYFLDPNLTVMRSGLVYFVLKIEPEDAKAKTGVEYKVSNQSIALIYKGDRKGVQVSAVGEGSCIITAFLGESKAEAVLTVTPRLEAEK